MGGNQEDWGLTLKSCSAAGGGLVALVLSLLAAGCGQTSMKSAEAVAAASWSLNARSFSSNHLAAWQVGGCQLLHEGYWRMSSAAAVEDEEEVCVE